MIRRGGLRKSMRWERACDEGYFKIKDITLNIFT